MEGPYIDPNPSLNVGQVLKESKVKEINKYLYSFLYDRHTSIQICQTSIMNNILSNNQKEQIDLALKFLKGNFIYDNIENTNSLISNSNPKIIALYSNKKNFKFNQDESIHKIDSPYYHGQDLKRMYPILFFGKGKIKNTEAGAFLTHDDKTIDLTTALRKYFVKSVSNDELAKKISYFVNFPSPESRKKLQLIFNRIERINRNPFQQLEKQDYKLLKTSKILAVWTMIHTAITNENNETGTMYNQLVGLAKDKNDKLFYWVTDLGQDISVLMKYNSKQ